MRINALMTIGALVGALLGSGAMAQAPAVSQTNGKLSLEGGVAGVDGHDGVAGMAQGSITVPIGGSFGFQADGAVGYMKSGFAWGVGGHLFWRDPARALVGLIASTAETANFEWTRVGVEGDLYLGQITLAGHGGYQWGNDSRRISVDSGFFGGADVRFYLTESFAMTAGGGIYAGDWLARGGLEFQPGLSNMRGLALFARGAIGEDNYYRLTAGVRFYFGADKSLMRRHREDDPESIPFENNTGEKKNRCIPQNNEQFSIVVIDNFCGRKPT